MRVGIIGMGGFAQAHHRAMAALEPRGTGRLVCTCDPNPAAFAQLAEELAFAKRGVRVFSNHREMLDACGKELDVVTIPTPIHLHAPMHRDVVERGLACYLEKPPTLDYRELEAMLQVDARAAHATVVGFNFIVEAPRQALKQRILDGDFGPLRRVSLLGLWSRRTTYFRRAAWAGRIDLDGRMVLDCCIGNAMAHYVHNLFFWSGRDELFAWGQPESVHAELYRAHAIQNFDTVFAQVGCDRGTEIRIAATHACGETHRHQEIVECERATIRYVTSQFYEIEWKDGRKERQSLGSSGSLEQNLEAYFAYVRGEAPRPMTRLEDSRPLVCVNNLVYVAARRIHPVPADRIARIAAAPKDEWLMIQGIEEASQAFVETAQFPSQPGRPWAQAGGRAEVRDLDQFPAVVAALARG